MLNRCCYEGPNVPNAVDSPVRPTVPKRVPKPSCVQRDFRFMLPLFPSMNPWRITRSPTDYRCHNTMSVTISGKEPTRMRCNRVDVTSPTRHGLLGFAVTVKCTGPNGYSTSTWRARREECMTFFYVFPVMHVAALCVLVSFPL